MVANLRRTVTPPTDAGHFKDEILDALAQAHNVAQFVSFAPGRPLKVRRSHIHGGIRPAGAAEAAEVLLDRSLERSVNIRSFDPFEPKSRDFVYGLKSVDDVLAHLERLGGEGLFTIVNETVDVHDGGVSGVVFGEVCEFSPDATPRAVEQAGTVSMSVREADRLIEVVYGFNPRLGSFGKDVRVEFSIHPQRRGLRHEHVIVWEAETLDEPELIPDLQWPNNFSRLIGDKTFGLLVAHLMGLPVPRTTVITRRLAPFSFGAPTRTGEVWTRTAPREPVPGYFTTQKGWIDPVGLWDAEDPSGETIASVLAQEGVDSEYSGALLADGGGALTIEGVSGEGDEFMQGLQSPVALPDVVVAGVEAMFGKASSALGGAVRMEWAYDGSTFWVLQMHRGASPTNGRIIFPGEAASFRKFLISDGIASLRALINEIEGTDVGIILVGEAGVTSHLGDILRRARIPSRIQSTERST